MRMDILSAASQAFKSEKPNFIDSIADAKPDCSALEEKVKKLRQDLAQARDIAADKMADYMEAASDAASATAYRETQRAQREVTKIRSDLEAAEADLDNCRKKGPRNSPEPQSAEAPAKNNATVDENAKRVFLAPPVPQPHPTPVSSEPVIVIGDYLPSSQAVGTVTAATIMSLLSLAVLKSPASSGVLAAALPPLLNEEKSLRLRTGFLPSKLTVKYADRNGNEVTREIRATYAKGSVTFTDRFLKEESRDAYLYEGLDEKGNPTGEAFILSSFGYEEGITEGELRVTQEDSSIKLGTLITPLNFDYGYDSSQVIQPARVLGNTKVVRIA